MGYHFIVSECLVFNCLINGVSHNELFTRNLGGITKAIFVSPTSLVCSHPVVNSNAFPKVSIKLSSK